MDRKEKERLRRAAETPEQREARLAKRRARYHSAEWLEKHRADCKAYYRANPDKFKEYERRKWEKPEHVIRERQRSRERHGVLGATGEQRHGECPICLREVPLVCDHKHGLDGTGPIRGWICNPCNRGLGMFNDAAPTVARALAYLNAFDQKELDQPAETR